MKVDANAVREAAHNLTTLLAENNGELPQDKAIVAAALASVVNQPEEHYEVGLPRVKTRLTHSRVIYFDPGLTFVLSFFPKGYVERVHNHGIVNIVHVCTGTLEFQSYRRLDDRSRPGYAKLEVSDNSLLKSGDVGLIEPPPNDIHGFEVLEDSWMITIIFGQADDVREFYDVATDSYTEGYNFDPAKAAAG